MKIAHFLNENVQFLDDNEQFWEISEQVFGVVGGLIMIKMCVLYNLVLKRLFPGFSWLIVAACP